MLLIQLLTVVHVVIQVGNKGDIYRSLKYCHYKIIKRLLYKIYIYLNAISKNVDNDKLEI